MRDFRSTPGALGPCSGHIADGRNRLPSGELADIQPVTGPAMIRDEDGMLAGYVYVDLAGSAVGTYLADAQTALQQHLTLPAGYTWEWGGQTEALQRAKHRLYMIVPITVGVILVILLINTRSFIKTMIVLLAFRSRPSARSGPFIYATTI